MFIYKEWSPSPSKWVTETICKTIAERSGSDKFVCNMIDSLASTNQNNTGKTTIEEMDYYFRKLVREGIGTGTNWRAWNSKGEVGRDEIKRRLKNSLTVGKPFNNIQIRDGVTHRLPTLWVFQNCREMAKSLKHWRLETWASNRQLATKDRKETPAQKFSHYCTALECLLKVREFRVKRNITPIRRTYSYYQGRG